jgi:Protein of unknown function (DUF2997)
MKTIEVIVSPTGETKVQTRGFTGGSCIKASALIEQALGRRTVEELTPEFFQGQSETQEHRQSQ